MWREWCCEDAGATAVLDSWERQPWSTAPIAAKELRTLDDLEVGLIAPRRFPLRRWFYANPIWYYHTPATEHKLRTDAKFYELVDPDLRELCHVLIESGLRTTPSCQGHFYPESRFTRIWDELVRESALVQSIGLIVKDSESDVPYRFRNPDYRLPWSSYAEFMEEASSHQHRGYIGIAVPANRPELAARFFKRPFTADAATLVHDEELTRVLGEPIFSVNVDPGTPEERDEAWQTVTRHVKTVLAA